MNAQTLAYVLFGGTLVVLFLVIIGYYYARNRHAKVEQAKYRMLDDDD